MRKRSASSVLSAACGGATSLGNFLRRRYLRAVWGANAKAIWAVGLRGVVVFNGGDGWKKQSVKGVPELRSVFGASANEVYAVGGPGAILRFNGKSWSTEHSGMAAYLKGGWMSPNGTAYAVGDNGAILRKTK